MCYCEVSWTSESWGFPKITEIPRKPWTNEVRVRDKVEMNCQKGNTVIYYSTPSSFTKLDFSVLKKHVALQYVGYVERVKREID